MTDIGNVTTLNIIEGFAKTIAGITGGQIYNDISVRDYNPYDYDLPVTITETSGTGQHKKILTATPIPPDPVIASLEIVWLLDGETIGIEYDITQGSVHMNTLVFNITFQP